MMYSCTINFLNKSRLAAIGCAMAMIFHGSLFSYVFDCEPPSGERMIAEDNQENDYNRDAFDRCQKGEGSERDQERAEKWAKDNIV